MPDAVFKHGNPDHYDYSPGANTAPGTVVVVGTMTIITTRRIGQFKTSEKGAAAMGGVWEMTADGALAAGAVVYWNNTSKKVSATSAGNTKFGYIAPGSSSAADGDKVWVIHRPGA
jgi:predicted RecA/RadA family phage recombinase